MSTPNDVICLIWIPPEEPEAAYRARLASLNRAGETMTEEEFYASDRAVRSAKFWRQRLPLVTILLLRKWYAPQSFLEYAPREIIMLSVQWGLSCYDTNEVLIRTTDKEHLPWKCIYLRKNIYSDEIAIQRLFSTSLAVHSLTHLIKKYVQNSTFLNSPRDKAQQNKEIAQVVQTIIDAVHFSLMDCNPYMGSINELLRLLSMHFGKYSQNDSKHHPYHWHTQKLHNIRMRLAALLSNAQSIFKSTLNEDKVINNHRKIIEGRDFCVNHLIPSMSNEYNNIQDLIIVVTAKGFYSKSVATNIVRPYPKGSRERASITKKLRDDGRIPSEKSMRTQLKWCESILPSCNLYKPITDQRWNNKGGRKRQALDKGMWRGSFWMDLHPIEMRVVSQRHGPPYEMAAPIITLDLFSTAKRVDICDYIWENKDVRLYFCPKQFRVPFDPEMAWHVPSFELLRWYIEYSSNQGDSPVKLKKKKKKQARFQCIHCKGDSIFAFVVKVDQFGYYIHVYNNDYARYVGWQYHNHGT